MLGPRRRASAHRQGDTGVTLIEMTVVLVIIAIIAALIVPNVIGRPDQASVNVAKSDIQTLDAPLGLCRSDARVDPTTEQGLDALEPRPVLAPVPDTWADAGYLAFLPQDPWGNPYVYAAPDKVTPFDLMSSGADGAPGGHGVDAGLTHLTAASG